MTLPYERSHAVEETRKFLCRICNPQVTPGLRKAMREEARALLRHYPEKSHLETVGKCWGDPFLQSVIEAPFGVIEK